MSPEPPVTKATFSVRSTAHLAGNDLQLSQQRYPLFQGGAYDFSQSVEVLRADVPAQRRDPGVGVLLTLSVQQPAGDELKERGHDEAGAEPAAGQRQASSVDHRGNAPA